MYKLYNVFVYCLLVLITITVNCFINASSAEAKYLPGARLAHPLCDARADPDADNIKDADPQYEQWDKSCINQKIEEEDFTVTIELHPSYPPQDKDGNDWPEEVQPGNSTPVIENLYNQTFFDLHVDDKVFLQEQPSVKAAIKIGESVELYDQSNITFTVEKLYNKACVYAFYNQEKWLVKKSFPLSVEDIESTFEVGDKTESLEIFEDELYDHCYYIPITQKNPAPLQFGNLISDVCLDYDTSSSRFRYPDGSARAFTSVVIECIEETIMKVFLPDEDLLRKMGVDVNSSEVSTFFSQMQSRMVNLIRALLALYVIVFGYRMMIGGDTPKGDEWKWLALKLVLVMYFAIGPGMVQLYPVLVNNTKQISTLVVSSTLAKGSYDSEYEALIRQIRSKQSQVYTAEEATDAKYQQWQSELSSVTSAEERSTTLDAQIESCNADKQALEDRITDVEEEKNIAWNGSTDPEAPVLGVVGALSDLAQKSEMYNQAKGFAEDLAAISGNQVPPEFLNKWRGTLIAQEFDWPKNNTAPYSQMPNNIKSQSANAADAYHKTFVYSGGIAAYGIPASTAGTETVDDCDPDTSGNQPCTVNTPATPAVSPNLQTIIDQATCNSQGASSAPCQLSGGPLAPTDYYSGSQCPYNVYADELSRPNGIMPDNIFEGECTKYIQISTNLLSLQNSLTAKTEECAQLEEERDQLSTIDPEATEEEYNALKNNLDSLKQELNNLKAQLQTTQAEVPEGIAGGYSYCDFREEVYPPGKEYIKLWDIVDCKLAKYLGVGINQDNTTVPQSLLVGVLSVISSDLGIPIFFFTMIYFVFVVMAIVRIVHIYIIAFIGVSLLVYISPLTIPSVMFKFTKSIFEQWLKQLIGFLLQPIILFAFLALVFASMDYVFFGDNRHFDHNDNIVYRENSSGKMDCTDPKAVGCIYQKSPSMVYNSGKPIPLLDFTVYKINLPEKMDNWLFFGLLKLIFVSFVVGAIFATVEELSQRLTATFNKGAAGLSGAPRATVGQVAKAVTSTTFKAVGAGPLALRKGVETAASGAKSLHKTGKRIKGFKERINYAKTGAEYALKAQRAGSKAALEGRAAETREQKNTGATKEEAQDEKLTKSEQGALQRSEARKTKEAHDTMRDKSNAGDKKPPTQKVKRTEIKLDKNGIPVAPPPPKPALPPKPKSGRSIPQAPKEAPKPTLPPKPPGSGKI